MLFTIVDEFLDAAAEEQCCAFPVYVPRSFALQKIQQLCVLFNLFCEQKLA